MAFTDSFKYKFNRLDVTKVQICFYLNLKLDDWIWTKNVDRWYYTCAISSVLLLLENAPCWVSSTIDYINTKITKYNIS